MYTTARAAMTVIRAGALKATIDFDAVVRL